MTREYGGPVKPVKVVTDAELYDNGGIYKLIGQKIALKVSNYDALTGLQRLQGGASIPVYPITQAQVDSGEYKLLGGSVQPVIEITKLAADFEATKKTYGQAAIPVLVVSGAAMQGAGGVQYGEEQTLTLQPDEDSGWDAYLQDTQADTPHNTADLALGKRTTPLTWRTLIGFDLLSQIPANAKVNSAIFSIWVDGDFAGSGGTWEVYRLKRAWVESQVTWNSYSTGNVWQTAGGFGVNDCEQTSIGSRDFTATETLGEMKDITLTPITGAALDLGFGWMIKATPENDNAYIAASSGDATASKRPKVVVKYQVPVGSEISYTQQVIFDGDSLTLGRSLSWKWNYPRQCIEALSAVGEDFKETNLGVLSQRILTMLANAVANVDALYDSGLGENIVVCWGGTNDLYLDATAEDVYNDIVSYCQGRQAAGFKVVVLTILPRSNPGTPAGFEAARQTVNGDIVSNWATFADALADVAADTRIGDSGDETDLTYYQSGAVHLNEIGAGVVADIVKTAIVGLL